ncbi:hypothetical protein [Niabella ginsenosidivorans]|nr:hypothetical protein [Niabella ginsenosidivorans]
MKLKLLIGMLVLAIAFSAQPANAQKKDWGRYEKHDHREGSHHNRDNRYSYYRGGDDQERDRRYHHNYGNYGYYRKMPPGQVKKYYRSRYYYSGNGYYYTRPYRPYPRGGVLTIAVGVPLGF